MDKTIVIATHDGLFHSDDAFAVAALFLVLEKARVVATVVRTRDENLIKKADFVADVGGIYDADKNRFDHHQAGGAGKRPSGISYAAFGLIWRKFGTDIAGSSALAETIDRKLVAPVDADDTGIDVYSKIFPDINPYTIADYIHNLRPIWQEDANTFDTRFLEAVALARGVLEREIAHARGAFAAAEQVRAAYENSPDKRLVVLDSFYPYEETLSAYPEPLFAVFPRPDGKWNLKTIRDDRSSFKNRMNLPESWAGKRDGELTAVTGVADAVFCHSGRFMAVAKTREGAIALAKLSLSQ